MQLQSTEILLPSTFSVELKFDRHIDRQGPSIHFHALHEKLTQRRIKRAMPITVEDEISLDTLNYSINRQIAIQPL